MLREFYLNRKNTTYDNVENKFYLYFKTVKYLYFFIMSTTYKDIYTLWLKCDQASKQYYLFHLLFIFAKKIGKIKELSEWIQIISWIQVRSL